MVRRACTVAGVAVVLVSFTALRCGSPPTTPDPPATCNLTVLSAGSQSFGPGGGTGTISVSSAAGCSWSVTTDRGWVTFTGGSTGTGSTSVAYTVGENTGSGVREATLTIELSGQRSTVRVVQEGRIPCDYTATTTSHRMGAGGGKGTIEISAGASCPWQATSSEAWLTFEGSAQGSGGGTITYVIAPWTGTAERSAVVRVGGREVTIWQDPPPPVNCTYSVVPPSFTLHWHDTGNNIQVQTGDGCTWTVASGTSWLSVGGASSRTGTDAVMFSVSTYTEENSRSAPVEIRWPTTTKGQNVWVKQEGCRYAFGYTTRAFTAAGGNDHVTVFRDPVSTDCARECPVSPLVNAGDPANPWIVIGNIGAHIVPDLELFYEVKRNDTGADRTGTIKVANRVLTITQGR